eukprot:875366-Rhodomonas_salina.1
MVACVRLRGHTSTASSPSPPFFFSPPGAFPFAAAAAADPGLAFAFVFAVEGCVFAVEGFVFADAALELVDDAG